MKPQWDALASAFNSDSNGGVIICEMERDEIPRREFNVQSYPQIKLFTADDKRNPIKYNGTRNVEHFESWLEDWSPKYAEYVRNNPE